MVGFFLCGYTNSFKIDAMSEDTACTCTAAICGHEGNTCGEPAKWSVKSSQALGDSEFTGEVETAICDKCSANIENALRTKR